MVRFEIKEVAWVRRPVAPGHPAFTQQSAEVLTLILRNLQTGALLKISSDDWPWLKRIGPSEGNFITVINGGVK